MSAIEIIPFGPEHKEALLDLTLRAWTPVFAKTQSEVPRFVYDAFYPEGWARRQRADVAALLETEPENFRLAVIGPKLAGFVGIRIHPQDRMGEIHIIAVSPAHQRKGVGRNLLQFAEAHIRAAGMKMIMVETVGDAGHEPARRVYEAFGFEPWPVARYFKPL